MKIRVISCGVSTYWYAKRIGEVFETDGELDDDGSYEVLDCRDTDDDDGGDGYIQRVDCEIVGVTTAEIIAQKRADVARINAELAVLEAKYSEERRANRPQEGDYARLISGGTDIPNGAIVTVTQAEDDDYDGNLPFEVASVLLPDSDAEWVTDCERLTPAEAKSALLAQVEALFHVEEAEASREVSTQ